MKAKRALSIVLVVSALLMAAGAGGHGSGSVHALPPGQDPGPVAVSIPYFGTLNNEAGQPVADGAYAFTFTLYEAESGGEPLWAETQEGVMVQGGAFTVLLGSVHRIPVEVIAGRELWLAVVVRGPAEEEFTLLSPRQRVSAVSPPASVGAASA